MAEGLEKEIERERDRGPSYISFCCSSDGLIAWFIEHWVRDEDHTLDGEKHLEQNMYIWRIKIIPSKLVTRPTHTYIPVAGLSAEGPISQ